MIHLNRLPNQQRNEKVQMFLRRHWIEIFAMKLYLIGFIVLPLAFFWVLSTAGVDLSAGLWPPLMALGLSVYSLIVLLIMMTMFTDYYLDTWIVTNERIINIEQHALFSRIISTLHLNQVQDVTAEVHGLFATILTFGDVYIQTAGTRERFNFKNVNDPEIVKHKILKLVEADKRRHGDASRGLT